MFLESKSQQVIEELAQRMESAAVQLEFERAARYRDQIASLRRVHERQYASVGEGDVDIVAAATRAGTACILLMFVRGGRWLGDRVFSPRVPEPVSLRQVLEAFLAQHYVGAGSDREIPRLIVVNQALPTAHSLGAVLSQQCGHEVRLVCRPRGEQAHWLQTAETNVEQALQRHLASRQNRRRQVDQLREVLGVGTECRRMECFDISHSTGEAAVAACVVFDENGPVQSDYRRFNIEGITPGDDYAALRQALSRRYKRLLGGEGKLPDLLFIDGGAGQMAAAQNILRELQVSGVRVVGVAKGPDRRPGHEVLYLGDTRLGLTADSPALHWVQQIRDEAHRFAITGHRQRRARRRAGSPLERIAGVGPGRRRALLRHFGGLQEVARTGVEDLARVPGISRHLAQRIYDALHCAD
jgi:excinuclease ABC subunit C